MSEDIDKLISDIEAEKKKKLFDDETLKVDDETAERLKRERRTKASGFELNLNLDDLPGDRNADDSALSIENEKPSSDPPEISGGGPNQETQHQEQTQEKDDAQKAAGKPASKRTHTAMGCVKGIIYAVLVFAVSGVLAYFMIVGGLDYTGINKSDTKVPVTLTAEQAGDTAEVARVLKEAGVIDQPLIFRLYCKLKGIDGKFKPQDEVSISPDMGYSVIVGILRSTVREVVRVTFPEGMTVAQIAKKLENNKVCLASDFYLAMDKCDFDYWFLNEIPDGEEYKGRFEKFEGYIFPDSYDFYVGSSGEAVLRKFFEAFNNRVDASIRAAIKAKDMTLNDTIILASIIQWEAAKPEDMYRISRVIHNRLQNPGQYPRLECDSTQKYVRSIIQPIGDQHVENLDYDTYKRKGLPIGAICNPGLEAIKAAINPSDEDMVKGRYFFATDMSTGITYYSKTLAEHETICRRYRIGMYA
ncbi:MAG: endolytic transglycosylase MltG [Oscillospiraceae bacterium]|nr:endolytic transglycosylase MltG [Oscillospiraceae bacterium]